MKLGIITPVGRYLGFSAPISPVDQFNKAVGKYHNIELRFIDPQRAFVATIGGGSPVLFDENGDKVKCDIYFPFGHTLLDRNMTKYIILALETSGAKVINGYKALTMSDDKALLALSLAKTGIPVADSVIASARPNAQAIIGMLHRETIISKMSGFSAGGVGVKPLSRDIDFLAPELWMSRMDERPRIIQNDLEHGKRGARKVVRAYVVDGRLVGCYATEGYGVVNCAGLARESVASVYNPTEKEEKIFIKAAKVVGAEGYCRIDAVGGDNFAIIEINPLARMDADAYGIDIASEILDAVNRMTGGEDEG